MDNVLYRQTQRHEWTVPLTGYGALAVRVDQGEDHVEFEGIEAVLNAAEVDALIEALRAARQNMAP